MTALGGSAVHRTERLTGEGIPGELMPCASSPANARNPRNDRRCYFTDVYETSQARPPLGLRHLGREQSQFRSRPFPISHVVPRSVVTSLSVAGSKNNDGGFTWSDKRIVEKQQ
jgi:hypothetical protein